MSEHEKLIKTMEENNVELRKLSETNRLLTASIEKLNGVLERFLVLLERAAKAVVS